MTLKDIGDYKNKLFSIVLQSDEISELMLGSGYDKNDVEELLVYKHIFPYLYVDDTQTEPLSYICIEVDVPRTMDFTFKDMKVIIWCYCHKEIMKYSKKDYLGTRADVLSDMVDRLLNSSGEFGIGRLQLQSSTYFMPNQRFYGRQLIYNCPEFNIKKKVR